MKLYSLYKMGSNEPEYTEVTREGGKEKTHTNNTQDRGEKKVASPQTRGRLADENSHRDPGTAIMR